MVLHKISDLFLFAKDGSGVWLLWNMYTATGGMGIFMKLIIITNKHGRFSCLCVFFNSLTQGLKFLSLLLGIVLGPLFSSGDYCKWDCLLDFSPCIPVTAI